MTRETAIKPFLFIKGNELHVRYTVDRCMKLSSSEVAKLKDELTASPAYKQSILGKTWNFLSVAVGREIIHDGIAELEKQIKEFKNGRKD